MEVKSYIEKLSRVINCYAIHYIIEILLYSLIEGMKHVSGRRKHKLNLSEQQIRWTRACPLLSKLSSNALHWSWHLELMGNLKKFCCLLQQPFGFRKQSEVKPRFMVRRFQSQSVHQKASCDGEWLATQFHQHFCSWNNAGDIIWLNRQGEWERNEGFLV